MPRGSVTLDTSAMIEYFMGTELGRAVKAYLEALKPEEKVYCSLYSISEIFYVLCRLKGLEYALEKMDVMLSSQVVEVENTEEMALEAGRLKCERAISLGDCSCIATAKITRSRAVFAQKEKDVADERKRSAFDVELLFLSELSRPQDKNTEQRGLGNRHYPAQALNRNLPRAATARFQVHAG